MGIELNIREMKEEKPKDDSLFQWGLLIGLIAGGVVGGVLGYNLGKWVPKPASTSSIKQIKGYQGTVKEVYTVSYNRADNYLPFRVSIAPEEKTPNAEYLIKCIDRPNRGSSKINLSKLEELIKPEMGIVLNLDQALHRKELLIDPTKILSVGGINKDLLLIKIK
ncbi:MAG: hypothetical protein Q8R00_03870 [Candidatus Nanoarchaeia archaeon]|nr:hypothetical protein [Candidatus Nanoarchaeia archaeon]